jgi:hypothetical protein
MPKKRVTFMTLLVLGLWALDVQAVVLKKLRIETNPSGAETFLLEGTRKVPLGTTPLEYEAEFHSEISILRMLIKKTGYSDFTLEVSASQDKIVAALESLGISEDPNFHKDPNLRKIQEQINPIIDRIIPELLEHLKQMDSNLAGHISVTAAQDDIFLVVPVVIENLKDEINGTGKSRREMLLKALWGQLGGSIAIPLARKFREHEGITGILLQAKIDENRYVFSTLPTLESNMKMVCVAGYRTQQVLQLRQIPQYETYSDNRGMVYQRLTGYRTESYIVPQQVFDPCISRRPITTVVPKFGPKVNVVKDQAVATFLLPLKILERNLTPEKLYEELTILLINSKGEQLEHQGSRPIPILR